MHWDDKTDEFVLDTGRRIYAHRRLLSVRMDEPNTLYNGYDSSDDCGPADLEWQDSRWPCQDMTPEERREIALFMIDAWARWASMPGSVQLTFLPEPRPTAGVTTTKAHL